MLILADLILWGRIVLIEKKFKDYEKQLGRYSSIGNDTCMVKYYRTVVHVYIYMEVLSVKSFFLSLFKSRV